MLYTATVTSQGQITIPAKFRRELDLDRAIISVSQKDKETIEIKKIPTLLSLAGSLTKYAKNIDKGLSSQEIIRRDKRAIDDARKKDYERYLKRQSDKPIII